MANQITRAKKKLNVDDAGLAAILGLHRTTIKRMEMRKKIAKPVAVLLDQLLAGPDAEPISPPQRVA